MRNRKILMLTTILTISSVSNFAMSADTVTDQIAKQPSAAVSTRTENAIFEYSARKILGYVSEARVALGNKQKTVANSYIDNALKEIDNIRNANNYLEMVGVQFGRILYGDSNSYYIPIADDTYAVRTYANGPFWSSDKTTAIKDVELITVDIAINPDKATTRLQAAKDKIAVNDYASASSELKSMLDESIRETTSTDQPFMKLQDNIYLTRVLIRQQNYDSARYTLKHAKAALSDYETTATTKERKDSIKTLHKEIDDLDNTIKKKDPTALQKAASKVDKWWNDIKSWAK